MGIRELNRKGSEKVYGTGYKPYFGYKALVRLLKQHKLDVRYGQYKETKSYYIDAHNVDETVFVEIRLSNHTKFQLPNEELSYSNIYGNDLENFEANIVNSQGYADAKQTLIDFLHQKGIRL